MTTKQLLAQGPTMKKVSAREFNLARVYWDDAETWRRWDELRVRIEQRRNALMSARRRYRRRIGLPR